MKQEKKCVSRPSLSRDEYQQLIYSWNKTAVDYPKTLCVHQLFEEQVVRTPDAVAVVFENESLSYQQLNECANQLAYYLTEKGVCADAIVGLCVTRSLDMIVGMLAILKAGGAYVPLDPDYPAERLSFIIHDADVSVLLALTSVSDVLPEKMVETIFLDADRDVIAQNNTSNLDVEVELNNLAYVIYTSGSTGKPKGVLNQHSGIVNLLLWSQNYYQLDANDVILQKAPYSFDASVLELFLPLITGSRLVFAKPGGHRDNQYLISIINELKVTSIIFVPSMLQTMINTPGFELCKSLKRVLCGGEVLPLKLAKEFISKLDIPLYNVYGPTEAAVVMTTYRVTGHEHSLTIPIGKPIGNTQLYVLDKNTQPVTVGKIGELHIGGVQLARGYLNRHELTDETFIPNPFSDDSASRLYKTGDLARYLADGNIEFLGRLDHQVKLRGSRIELGEIEAAIMQYPGINTALVTLYEGLSGDKRLVAYLVPENDYTDTYDTSELSAFLKLSLPDYMLPSALVVLEQFPLTANGKIDRNALPTLEQESVGNSEQYVAPSSLMEVRLAQWWSDLLYLKRVGIHDNFFERGGDSLLAMQLAVQIGRQLNLEIPVFILFELPTIAQQKGYLEELLRQDVVTDLIPIKRISRAHPIAVSFAQQRLWFLEQLSGASNTYNIPLAIRLKGTINIPVLKQSINTIVQRHEVLRTRFSEQSGKPVQVILPELLIDCPLIDLQSMPETQRKIKVQKLISEESKKSFDLTHEALLRILLIQLSENEHVFMLTIHHIVSDGWSLSVLFQELTALYAAFLNEKPSPLTELPVQYVDYAVWQREWLQGERFDNQLAYWKVQLDGLDILELPTDFPRPVRQSYQGSQVSLNLSATLTGSLKALSQKHGVTLYMTLLATLQVLLHRYSRQDDIVVGGAIAGRNHQQIENLIGFFVNTLILRTDLSGNPTFEQLLKKVQNVCLEAYAHQDTPFEKLVSELQPERDMSRHPFFQVMLVLQNTPQSTLQLPDLTAEKWAVDRDSAKFDLSISLEETAEGLWGEIEYATDLFHKETIQRLAGHFETLLQGIVAQSQLPIAELPLLSVPEQHQILEQWNETKIDYPKTLCVHQLFEAQAEETPDAVALVFKNESLSYQQLNERANQLAHYLSAHGVQKGSKIGISLNRSVMMVSTLLAVLKTGACYVGLDPTYPAARLRYIMNDASLKFLLTEAVYEPIFNQYSEKALFLDCAHSQIALYSQEKLKNNVCADDLAYITYTSGSTGKPKGVCVQHCAVNNFLQSMKHSPGMQNEDRLLAVTTLSFDISVLEICLPLICGARVIIADRKVSMDGHLLTQIMEKEQINFLQATPITWKILLASGWQPKEKFTALCGGEALPYELAQELSQIFSDVWNMYGPSETTVWSTCYRLSNSEESVCIGKPIDNTQTYILDRTLQPVPIGVPGELYIGGDGLAQGYLNRPELTAEKFIPNLFSDESSSRLYKTGDLARYLADGNIEFLGRLDHQVKLRGFRIELGEIEASLMQHPSINMALVTLDEDQTGYKRLVAYMVPENDSPDTSELRTFLKISLPDYMLPSAFVVLEQFPLTPNGKIDRKALPAPEQEGVGNSEQYVAPSSLMEVRLAQLWSDLLHLKRVGIHDNFFECGGDSLLVVQLVAHINEEFRKKIPVEEIFKHSTIKSQVNLLQNSIPLELKEFHSMVTPIRSSGSKAPLFWLFGGKVVPSIYEHLDVERPFYFLNHQTMVDGKPAKYTDIKSMACYYLDLIQEIEPNGPYLLGGFSAGGLIAYDMAQQLKLQGKDIELLFLLSPSPPGLDFYKEQRKKSIILQQKKKIHDLGYRVYSLDLICKIFSKIQNYIKKIALVFYTRWAKTLPVWLRSLHINTIYYRAFPYYSPVEPPLFIRKTILIHEEEYSKENKLYLQQWKAICTGELELYSVDFEHLELIETVGEKGWLIVLSQELEGCS